MANSRIKDLPSVGSPASGDRLALDGSTTRSITQENLAAFLNAVAGALTNKTFDTGGSGNSFLINGVAANSNTGTGAVVRAVSPSLTNPDVTTQTPGNNTTKAASTAFVTAAIVGVGGGGGPFQQAGAGAVLRTMQDKAREIVSAADFGAKGDAVEPNLEVSINAGSTAMIAFGGSFTSADVGKTIVVPGIGAAGIPLITTIAAVLDSVHITLATAASTTVLGTVKKVNYGTDNTPAFHRAFAAYYGVAARVAPGNYLCATPVTVPTVSALIGDNCYTTRLIAATTGSPLISLPDNTVDQIVSGLWLTRAAPATPGGDGVQMPGYNENVRLEDLYVADQYNGLRLGITGNSYVRRCLVVRNYGHGVWVLPVTGGGGGGIGGGQWQLQDILSSSNEGDGFRVDSTYTSTGSLSLGNWTNIRTFANHGAGIALIGKPGQGIYNMVCTNVFVGADAAAGEIYLDSYGGNNLFTNVNIELAGNQANGRDNLHAAPNAGSGVYITENNDTATFVNLNVNSSSNSGFRNRGRHTTLCGGNFSYNGMAGSESYGVWHEAGSMAMTGVSSNNQAYGLVVSSDTLTASGCNLDLNSTGPILELVPLVNSVLQVYPARTWKSYTPTVSPTSGAFTTLGAVSGAYERTGKTVKFRASVTITANGSAAGAISISLPFASLGAIVCVGVDAGVSGKGIIGSVGAGAASMSIRNADASYPGASGAVLVINGEYEAA